MPAEDPFAISPYRNLETKGSYPDRCLIATADKEVKAEGLLCINFSAHYVRDWDLHQIYNQ